MLVEELPYVSISIDNDEPMLEEFDASALEEIVGSVVDRRVRVTLFARRMRSRRGRDRANLV